jgi:hypothetical protein
MDLAATGRALTNHRSAPKSSSRGDFSLSLDPVAWYVAIRYTVRSRGNTKANDTAALYEVLTRIPSLDGSVAATNP